MVLGRERSSTSTGGAETFRQLEANRRPAWQDLPYCHGTVDPNPNPNPNPNQVPLDAPDAERGLLLLAPDELPTRSAQPNNSLSRQQPKATTRSEINSAPRRARRGSKLTPDGS